MCFQAILYECGHEEKSILECRNRIGLRGLVKTLLDLLRPNEQVRPLPCDDVAADLARRGHKCRWCLMQQIPDLLQRERQRLRILRGDFVDSLVDPVPVRSLPPRALQRSQSKAAKRDLHALYRRHSLPQYAWVASPDESGTCNTRSNGDRGDSKVELSRKSPGEPSRKLLREAAGETANTLRSQSLWLMPRGLSVSRQAPVNDSVASFTCVTAHRLEEMSAATKHATHRSW